ncbi:hypothetical protein [Alicyclobacillus macrosporangiidus]|nr:hypothetical protein [Alicyclobacillus macrosporangiidus]
MFVVEQDGELRHVVVMVPMPSEADLLPLDVFQVALKQGRYPLVP